ncbi:MAG: PAS domain S-box protein, partial [Chloroflexi bacterium]|nr:PAS domain S-box protein [Chloroflexota bacterium]
FRAYLQEIAQTGQRLSTEVEMRGRDGTPFYAQLQTVALYEKSNIIYRVSVADITARRQAEKAVRESEERYRSLFESSLDGIAFTDLDGHIRFANTAYQKMLGYTMGELRETTYQQLTPARWHEMEATIVHDQILARGYADVYEKEYIRKDGTVFPIALRVWLIRDESGQPTGMWGIVRDITERKRAEQALRENEQKYRELADSLAEGIFETDIRGVVTYLNAKAFASFNFNPDDLRRGISIFEYIAPQYVHFARERFARVLQQQDTGSEEYVLRRKDDTTFPALVHSLAIVREGKVQGTRGIVVDITERKRAEQALIESEKRFRTALDSMMEGCLIIDFNWRYVYANDAVARQGRFTREQFIGHTMKEVTPNIEETEVFARLKESMEKRMAQTLDTEFTYPDGVKRWFEIRMNPVPEGLLVLYVNITERKLAEQRLQRGIERLEHIYSITKLPEMQPVALLMIEHRLIERVVALLAEEKARMEQTDTLAGEFIGYMVDFFRTYADRTHHGKEEELLFKPLAGKPLAPDHRRIMDELVREHELSRKLVSELVEARNRWESGDTGALKQLVTAAGELVKLYPKHIETEDKHFFLPSMAYFSAQEQDNMLLEFAEFDRQIVHQKYTQGVEALKGQINRRGDGR